MWILNAIQSGDTLGLILGLAVRLLMIFFILPVHEWAHGFVAYKLGDNTAKYDGRLTLNPMAHIDYIGSLALLLFGFGWAKPVPVNPYNFKKRKRDMAFTALAGPVSNLIVAIIGVMLYNIVLLVFPNMSVTFYKYFYFFIQSYISINITLAVFNLLPVPPLDGSRIFGAILPDKWVYKMNQYERYITLGLFLLLFLGVLDPVISFLTRYVGSAIIWIGNLPFSFF